MKLYDFDGMFDEKLGEFMRKNAGKYKEEEWEDIIPQMYARFGDTKILSLGKTPNEFYGEMDETQLIKCLRSHLKQNVPVSEFLCNAIENKCAKELLLPLLDGTKDEIAYALNLLGAAPCAVEKYMELIVSSDDEDVVNTCVDNVKELADDVKTLALENYKKGVKPQYMLEILSRCKQKDDRIFDILLKEFRTDADEVCMHASYLAAYGDERALSYLLDKIDEEGISFVEYQELKYAIEALGGSYDKPRDFSNDEYYKIIKSHGVLDVDIFKDIK